MKQTSFFLTRFNRLFLQLYLTPLVTLIYAPINRYIVLPKLGSGRPYQDMNGVWIDTYFNANDVARILFYLVLAASLVLTIRQSMQFHGWKRAGYLILCTLISLVTGVAFLEFTVWS